MSDKRQRFADQRYVFFVTFSVYKRRRLLDLDQPKRILLGVLNHLLDSLEARCIGFVLMPDHVHALIWLPNPEDLTRFLHGWKRMSSFRIREWYAAHAEHRLFPHVTRKLQGLFLTSYEMFRDLARQATTATGLRVFARSLRGLYELGQRATLPSVHQLRILYDTVLPQWNYHLIPQPLWEVI